MDLKQIENMIAIEQEHLDTITQTDSVSNHNDNQLHPVSC